MLPLFFFIGSGGGCVCKDDSRDGVAGSKGVGDGYETAEDMLLPRS